MERFTFAGSLFVPVANLGTQFSFVWGGTLTSPNNKVDVIIFKTDTKEQIIPLLEADLEILQKLEQTDNIKAQIAFIEQSLEQLPEGSVWRKEPDAALLQAASQLVCNILSQQGKSLQMSFTKDNVLYTSGVSGVYK